MPSQLAYQIADDIVKELFTNGAKQKASRLVLELAGGRDGGGWSYRPARNHIADVIEKHIARIGSVEHSVQRTARKRRAKKDVFDPRDVSILGGDPSL